MRKKNIFKCLPNPVLQRGTVVNFRPVGPELVEEEEVPVEVGFAGQAGPVLASFYLELEVVAVVVRD
jgi:hypothetical protein